jgi:hypothetical protein
MSVILTILIGLLIVGGMLVSRLMGVFGIFDEVRMFMKQKDILDMYEDAKEQQRDRDL